jgi:hypothetical protein
MRFFSLRGIVRLLLFLALAAVPVIGLIDGGRVGYNRLSTQDDAKTVARAAAQAVRDQPLTQQTAVIAYQAAESTARSFGATVVRKDFTVHRDGKVTLTLERTVHTLVLGHLPFLQDITVISETVTAEPSPYT